MLWAKDAASASNNNGFCVDGCFLQYFRLEGGLEIRTDGLTGISIVWGHYPRRIVYSYTAMEARLMVPVYGLVE